jgi:rubrerythrin
MGFLSRVILKGVVRSALALEAESIATYQGLRKSVESGRSCSDALNDSLCRLLAEEELHRKILLDAGDGRLSLPDLERLLAERRQEGAAAISPLDNDSLADWGQEISSALEHEEKTWIFYSNLRRMSRIPSVRRAFQALATMEKEHVDMLRMLLGRSPGAENPR